MGRRYAAVLRAAHGVEICGYADPNPEAREAVCRIAAAPAFADHRALLAEIRPDAVCVCTPDDRHRAPAVDALETGAALLVEKPLATSVEDAGAIERAAARSGAVAMVGHLLRFEGRYAAARQAVAAGGVGHVHGVHAHRYAAAADRRRRGPRASGLWHLAVHDVDLVRWITGREIIAVAASGSNHGDEPPAIVAAHLALDGGGVAALEAAWVLPDAFCGHVWTGLVVMGSTGCVEVPSTHAAVAAHAGNAIVYTDPTRFFEPPGLPAQGALREEIAAFLNAVRTGTPSPVPVADGRRAVEIVAALERALAEGTRVTIAA